MLLSLSSPLTSFPALSTLLPFPSSLLESLQLLLLPPPRPYLLICSSHEGHPAPRLKDTWWCWMQHMLLCSTTCENVAWKQCSYKYSMQPAPSALSGAACSTYKCKVPDWRNRTTQDMSENYWFQLKAEQLLLSLSLLFITTWHR